MPGCQMPFAAGSASPAGGHHEPVPVPSTGTLGDRDDHRNCRLTPRDAHVKAGAARPLMLYGRDVLHHRCAPVTNFDEELAALVDDMFASMYAAEGVGLAANQVGVGLRVFVYDCPDATGAHQAGHVINPVLRIPAALAPRVSESEGCLSVPGQHAELSRPAVASVTGRDLRGGEITVTGSGLLARCLQHEADHLDGIVYVDKLPAGQRAALLAAAGLHAPGANL